jgi:hypothetical protein
VANLDADDTVEAARNAKPQHARWCVPLGDAREALGGQGLFDIGREGAGRAPLEHDSV